MSSALVSSLCFIGRTSIRLLSVKAAAAIVPCSLLHVPRFVYEQEELVINGAAMNIELYGIESQILKLLSESEGNILDNTALIETLAEAKVGTSRPKPSEVCEWRQAEF